MISMILLQACSSLVGYKGQLVFESNRDGNSDIYLIDADGQNLLKLTDDEAYDGTPSFSPDGAFIAFTSDRTNNAEVYVMGSDGLDPEIITSGQGYSVVPAFSPDSSKLLFSSNRSYRIPVEGGEIDVPDTTKLWTIDFETRQLERLTSNIGLDMYGSYSPSQVFQMDQFNSVSPFFHQPNRVATSIQSPHGIHFKGHVF
jgi:TolB protein